MAFGGSCECQCSALVATRNTSDAFGLSLMPFVYVILVRWSFVFRIYMAGCQLPSGLGFQSCQIGLSVFQLTAR